MAEKLNLVQKSMHKIRELQQEIEFKDEYITTLEDQGHSPFSNVHREREIEQENQMFKELIESLEDKSSVEMDEFFSMISHELKTPLVPIQGYANMLKGEHLGKLENVQKEKLEIIESNTVSLSKLIQNVLDYQKLSHGKMEIKKENSKVKNIIKSAVDELSPEFDKKIIKKQISCDDDLELICDAKKISQVLVHLLGNSLKAIQSKTGQIKISATKLDKMVKISVYDNGCGIPAGHLSNVFSKFFQVDMSNTREKQGIGLGLSICEKIIDIHHGKIWIDSKSGQGTTVSFILPCH